MTAPVARAPGEPLVIGVAGGTASGKSTLASALVARLPDQATLLVHDRYYHPLPEALRDRPIAHNFDHPDALDTARLVADLDRLRTGEGAWVPVYDFARHDRADEEAWVPPRPVVVVEGILVLADPALRERLHRAIYVHTPDDLRLIRRLRRDVARRGRTVEAVLAQYEATVRPMHEQFVAPSRAHADVVVSGVDPLDELVAGVERLVRAWLG